MTDTDYAASGCEVYADLAEWYDLAFTGLLGEVQFYTSAAREAGSPVLELGCGTGRITLPVAQAGVDVVGLDLVPGMLNVARRKLVDLDPAVAERVTLVQGDMRDFTLDTRFQLAMIPFRAFLHLQTVDDQRRALACIRRHLVPGGRLALNVFDPHLAIIQGHAGTLGTALKKTSEFDDPATGHRVVVWDSRQYDPGRQLIDQDYVFDVIGADGIVAERRYSALRLRYVHRFEMGHLLELCGFEVESFCGDFDGGPFRYGGEQVWVARAAV